MKLDPKTMPFSEMVERTQENVKACERFFPVSDSDYVYIQRLVGNANALPCESCGEPCEDRQTATWDQSLQVGPCCQFDAAQIPELPICEDLYKLTMRAKTVGELMDIRRAHVAVCHVCNPDAQEIREAA